MLNVFKVLAGVLSGVASCCFLAAETGRVLLAFGAPFRGGPKQHPVRANTTGRKIFLSFAPVLTTPPTRRTTIRRAIRQ